MKGGPIKNAAKNLTSSVRGGNKNKNNNLNPAKYMVDKIKNMFLWILLSERCCTDSRDKSGMTFSSNSTNPLMNLKKQSNYFKSVFVYYLRFSSLIYLLNHSLMYLEYSNSK